MERKSWLICKRPRLLQTAPRIQQLVWIVRRRKPGLSSPVVQSEAHQETGEMAEPDQVRVDFQPELQETQTTSGQISR